MERRFSKDSNFKDLLRRNKDAIVYAALNGLEATNNFKLMRSLIIAKSLLFVFSLEKLITLRKLQKRNEVI